jgi:hypothetical protein
MPLPPLSVQKTIVELWQQAQTELQAARAALQVVTDNLNATLYDYYHAHHQGDVLRQRWLVVDWKELARWDVKTARAAAFRLATPGFAPMGRFVEEATQLVKPWEEPDKEWPVYGVNNKEGVFFSHYQKGHEFNSAYKHIRRDWFFHNPTRSSVGSLGIVPDVPEDAITSPEYQVWRIKWGLIPGYVAVLINSPFFIELIQFHRVGAVKQRLYVDNLLEISIPVISLKEQQQIADARAAALARLAQAQQRVIEVNSEVEALILGTKSL